MKTLRRLMEEHPEWTDVPLAVLRDDGSLDFVGEAGLVYLTVDEEGEQVVVFAKN